MPCVRAVLVPNPGLAGLRQGPCPLIPAKLRCFAVTVSHQGTAAGARWRPAGPCGVAAAPYRLLVGRNATVCPGGSEWSSGNSLGGSLLPGAEALAAWIVGELE